MVLFCLICKCYFFAKCFHGETYEACLNSKAAECMYPVQNVHGEDCVWEQMVYFVSNVSIEYEATLNLLGGQFILLCLR